MKKHKKWEGDAVLIIKGRSATLRSLEGKELSSAFGYKVKEVDAIEEGSIFSIGGKECEIQASISTEEYLSGRCFSDGFVPAATQEDSKQSKTSAQQNATVKFPAFRSPHVGGLPSNASSKKIFIPPPSPQIKPDSLVMPRPNNIHQWDNNKKNLPVTDVVVEDSLTRCLRPHQREGVVFLYECIMQMRAFDGCGAILADEMGLGKTLQCIALIWTLLRQGPYGGQPCLCKIIIVTPSSLVKNWVKEFKKWLQNRNLRVYHVDQNNKIDIFLNDPSMYPVLILSYEMYMRVSNSLSGINFDLLICDEAHRLKNANIKTTEGHLFKMTCKSFLPLLISAILAYWASRQVFVVSTRNPFCGHNFREPPRKRRSSGQARANELMQTTSPFILRRTQDVIQSYLPGKVECVVFCRPQPLQLALYQNMLETNMVRACLSSYLSTDANCHLACILALRKLCNHPLLVASPEFADKDEDSGLANLHAEARRGLPSEFDPTMMDLELGSGKLVVLSAMLHSLWTSQPRERIVLVSNFTKTLDILEDVCMQKGYPFLRLDGSTSSTQRLELVERFNSPHSNCFVFLLSCKAGGVGLNLVGASRIVLYDVDWNPANDLQAMARVFGGMELSGTVLDSKKDGKRAKFSLEDLKDLFTLDEETTSSTHKLLGCRCDSVEETDDDFCSSHPQAGAVAEPSSTPKRSSQLGSATTHSIIGKKLGMSDLLRWEHIPAPIGEHFLQDPHLVAAEDNITFVFRNTVSKAQKENVCFSTNQYVPFVKDRDGVAAPEYVRLMEALLWDLYGEQGRGEEPQRGTGEPREGAHDNTPQHMMDAEEGHGDVQQNMASGEPEDPLGGPSARALRPASQKLRNRHVHLQRCRPYKVSSAAILFSGALSGFYTDVLPGAPSASSGGLIPDNHVVGRGPCFRFFRSRSFGLAVPQLVEGSHPQEQQQLEPPGSDHDVNCGLLGLYPSFMQSYRSPRCYLICLCVLGMTQGFVVNGLVSVVTPTIEKRFQLLGVEVGMIQSMFNVASCIMITPVSYHGGVGHKPVIMGIGALVVAAGSMVFASPHFLAPPYISLGSGSADVGHALHGVGSSPFFTLGVAYLDQNTPSARASIFMGIFYATSVLGPAMGFLLGGYFLSMYTDITADSSKLGMDPSSANWVGAWWLGFFCASIVTFVTAFPIASFPRALPTFVERAKDLSRLQKEKAVKPLKQTPSEADVQAAPEVQSTPDAKATTQASEAPLAARCAGTTVVTQASPAIQATHNTQATRGNQATLGTQPKPGSQGAVGAQAASDHDAPQDMQIATEPTVGKAQTRSLMNHIKRLMRNPTFVCLTFAACAETMIASGLTGFATKIFISMFGISSSQASYPSSRTLTFGDLRHSCNAYCNCSGVGYDPVCGSDNFTYYSPCVAGMWKREALQED
ncbi:hypothetical protein MTO96_009426 [Rhipicephalus appendiculatus]